MFSGKISAKLDAKGRVFFPAAFRKQLGAGEGQFVLRRDVHQPCLVLFPQQAWEKEVEQLRARLNRWDVREAMLFRSYVGEVEQIALDSVGRLLLSKAWQQQAHIDREVTFVGVYDRIEIWPALTSHFLDDDAYSQIVQDILG